MINIRFFAIGMGLTILLALGAKLYMLGGEKATLQAEIIAERLYSDGMRLAKEQAEENLRIVNVANELNSQLARADQIAIQQLEEKASETPANSNRCLDADAARRVRAIR